MMRVDTNKLRQMFIDGVEVKSPHGKGRRYRPRIARKNACKKCCIPTRDPLTHKATECVFSRGTSDGDLVPSGLCIPVYDDSFMADVHAEYISTWVNTHLLLDREEKGDECCASHEQKIDTGEPEILSENQVGDPEREGAEIDLGAYLRPTKDTKGVCMTDAELIARQAKQIAILSDEVADLKERAKEAMAHIYCIQGPLNGNKLGYTKEQMGTFARIAEELGSE